MSAYTLILFAERSGENTYRYSTQIFTRQAELVGGLVRHQQFENEAAFIECLDAVLPDIDRARNLLPSLQKAGRFDVPYFVHMPDEQAISCFGWVS
jgi:hypothetical protein